MITAREAALLTKAKEEHDKLEAENYCTAVSRMTTKEYKVGIVTAESLIREIEDVIASNAKLGRKRCRWASRPETMDNVKLALYEGIVAGLINILNLAGFQFRIDIEQVAGYARIIAKISWGGESP